MATRPYIICLMMSSMDGKILSEKWGKSKAVTSLLGSFEKVHEEIGHPSWIVGRTTMEKDFTKFAKPVYDKVEHPLPRKDFIGSTTADSFAVAVDGQGKLGWENNDMLGQHVITILTEAVEDGYLSHLQNIGVSYIFAGIRQIDLPLALEKLKTLFNIETLMLEGGGTLNGSFLNEGLIDEYHQLILPLADGRTDTSCVFEIPESSRKFDAALFQLKEVKEIEHGIVWLRYLIR